MSYRRFESFAVPIALLSLAVSLSLFAQDSNHRGRKFKVPPPTSRVDITILRNEDGKPIENAAVVFQLDGDKGNMELKTNEDGKTMIDVLPTGSKVLVQVIARGYQTYGADYKIDKPQLAIEVKLKRPGQQYSIYPARDSSADKGKTPDAGTGNDSAPAADSSKKDSTNETPAEPATQSDSKPDTAKPQPQ
jgi:hypothetical protein